MIFSGLSAFPLTPLNSDEVDLTAFRGLVSRLRDASVDSIGALGSTGSYAYLSRDERRLVAQAAVDEAGDVPVIVGVGALRTSQVLALAEGAQQVGASPPRLRSRSWSMTTGFEFSDELYAAISRLKLVTAIKVPPIAGDVETVRRRVSQLRAQLAPGVALRISGDGSAATALSAGCDLWFSVAAGAIPAPLVAITRAARSGDSAVAQSLSAALDQRWCLTPRHGSLRVIAAVAEELGLVARDSLPRPILGLGGGVARRGARADSCLQRGLGLVNFLDSFTSASILGEALRGHGWPLEGVHGRSPSFS